jgi:hypothetical protein
MRPCPSRKPASSSMLSQPLVLTDLVCAESDPPFPIIFQGSTMDHRKHASIHSYSRTWMVYGDPFGDKNNTSDPHIVGKPDQYMWSTTTPMSTLLQPRPPSPSSSPSQSLAASSSQPLATSSSSQSLAASSSSQSYTASSSRPSHSRGLLRSNARASGKSTIPSFFSNTYPVQ